MRRRNLGLTLLETLFALGISAMMAVALANMFATSNQVWRASSDAPQIVDEAMSRHDLWQALERMPELGNGLEIGDVFEPTAAGFRFLAPAAPDEPLAWFAIAHEEEDLVLTYPDGTSANLRTAVGQVIFSYYGAPRPEGTPQWKETWEGAVLLPRLIKIQTSGSNGIWNAPFTAWPAKDAAQEEISASSLAPPGWPSRP
ncbi:PulJ/GspJ family protein [Pseudoroseicyclus tamaricis]|uniref:Prepilin-type N-terminal cleavage/methylation domain-containing protein n=1 Tax=Pseudoroseicyclus tamaricis TaxID=2705421 RepID=A0A6B2JH77_9RHOB|nr:hypothetical protein [Pseudoroseicyclus tamaricis]NDV00573.1 hypothetical protein [Pseudoroseicyclus tamaricis]